MTDTRMRFVIHENAVDQKREVPPIQPLWSSSTNALRQGYCHWILAGMSIANLLLFLAFPSVGEVAITFAS